MNTKKIKASVVSLTMLVSSISAPLAVMPQLTANAASTDKSTYSDLLNASAKFYDANLCGDKVSGNSFAWRSNCHTFDAQIALSHTNINGNSSVTSVVDADGNGKVDVCGGYHDAGDHAKFGLPAAYTASTLGWSYYEFSSAFSATGASSQAIKTMNNFNDYFVKSTYLDASGNVTAFCYQVGDGTQDHNYWGSPEAQTDSTEGQYARTVYFATSSNPATDIVSSTAASLASSYVNTKNAEHLKYAKALYKFATSNNKQVATDGTTGFYSSSSYLDDMAWAAVWLYKATGDSSYLSDARSYITEAGYSATDGKWMHCWDKVWDGVMVMMAELDTANSATYWGYVKAELDNFMNNISKVDGTYSALEDWGSARYNAMAQMIACIYDKKNGGTTYSSWAETQMDYLLGNNNKNLCYVVGFNSKSVKNAHHRAAQGQSDDDSTGYSNTLTGALVGGPMKDGSYQDVTSQYKYSEVAIDYNAGLVGAAAGLYSLAAGISDATTASTTTTAATTKATSTTTAATTKATSTTTKATVAAETPTSQTVTIGKTLAYSSAADAEKNIVVDLSKFNFSAGTEIESFTFNIKSTTTIGTFVGGIGVSTSLSPSYWYQTPEADNINQNISGTSGSITWTVPTSVKTSISPTGTLQLGCYYFNSGAGSITLDSVTVNYKASATTSATTKATTSATTSATTKSTASTTAAQSSGTLTSSVAVNDTLNASDWSDTNNKFTVKTADFGIQAGDVITSVKFELSSSTTLGNCTFAYAMGVNNDCPVKTDDWWYQGDSFDKSFIGKTATLTWNVANNIGSYVNPDGTIELGAYYFNPDSAGNRSGSITLKNVTVTYTRASAGTTAATTKATTAATTKATTSATTKATTSATTKSTASTTAAQSGGTLTSSVAVNDTLNASDWSDTNNKFTVKTADFGIQAGDVITSVKFELSSSTTLGNCTFAYAMGVNNDCPAKTDPWWYQGDSFDKSFIGKTATLTWNVANNIGSYVNPDGTIELGAYYFNPDSAGNRSGSITLKNVTVTYTRASAETTAATTKATTAATTKATTSATTKATTSATSTTTASISNGHQSSVTVNDTINASEWSDENNKFTVKTADFGIQAGDIITSVKFELSSSTTLGNCTFAYAMGVTNSCPVKTDDWWYQGDSFDTSFIGKTATLTWNVDNNVGSYVNPDGTIELGAYYFNPDSAGNRSGSITLKNVTVTYTRPSDETTTAATTTAATTKAPVTTTTVSGSVTTAPSSSTTTTASSSSSTKKGDVTGDNKVNIADLVMLSKFIIGSVKLSDAQFNNADVTNDGKVNIADLVKLSKVLIGSVTL